MKTTPQDRLKELFKEPSLYNEQWFKEQRDFYEKLYINDAQKVNPRLYERLLKENDNGIALIGRRCPKIENIYEILIKNNDFITNLNIFFNEKNLVNFNKFSKSWEDITKGQDKNARMPLARINRVAATFSLNVTSACDGNSFDEILKWFKENQIIEKSPKGNWFEKNETFTKVIDGILEIDTDDDKIKRNVFIWNLYKIYVCKKKRIYDEIDFKNGENKMLNEKIKKLLITNKQVILTGAPGTGKTYTAEEIAKNMTKSNDEYLSVQFHPSFDYSDFVIGLKPKVEAVSGQVSFAWKDGIFKEFCYKALTHKDADFVFIIDEINRADLSRVFGELFSCIEEDYRFKYDDSKTKYTIKNDKNKETEIKGKGKFITLPNGELFTIPENVYIIGTMNDIDRSVESMDFALRRRFGWYEIKAEDSQNIIDAKDENDEFKIKNKDINKDIRTELKNRMTNLNNAIVKDKYFGEEYKIGGAYFLKYAKYKDNPIQNLWDNHIKVILSEYLRGRPNAAENLYDWEIAYNCNVEVKDDIKKYIDDEKAKNKK